MLKPHSLQNHKRRQSQIQLFYPQRHLKQFQSIDSYHKKQKSIKNNKKITNNNNKINNVQKGKQKQKNRILKLVSSSTDKIKQKNIVIENIDYQNNQNVNWMNIQNIGNNNQYGMQDYNNNYNDYTQNEPFFQFGRRIRRQIQYQSQSNSNNNNNLPSNLIPNTNLNMQQIIQVPDTMSNQRRYDTSHNIQIQNSLLKNLRLSNIISNNNNNNKKKNNQNTNNNNSLSFSKRLEERNNYNTNNANMNINDNFYQFKQQDTHEQTLQPLKSLSKILTQQSKQKNKQSHNNHNNTKKTLKQRKHKQPKKQYSYKQIQTLSFNHHNNNNNNLLSDKFDISQLMTLYEKKKNNRKSKQFIIGCNNQSIMSKSKILKLDKDKEYYSKSNKSKSNNSINVNKSKSKGKLIMEDKIMMNNNCGKNVQNKLKTYSQVSLSNMNQNKKSLSLSLKCKNNYNYHQTNDIKTKSSQKTLLLNNNNNNNSNPIIHTSTPSKKPQLSRPLLNNNLTSSNTGNLTKKIMLIQQSQSKLQNQYKILWQCIGQLWQNSRITRYISEKNKSQILKIKENQNMIDEKVIKMKSQIVKEISSARY